jgi:hypothetical protein
MLIQRIMICIPRTERKTRPKISVVNWYQSLPPNQRMQSDAATRPQDRRFFDSWNRSESHLDLSVRRG